MDVKSTSFCLPVFVLWSNRIVFVQKVEKTVKFFLFVLEAKNDNLQMIH